MKEPLANGDNGRDKQGRFAVGNKGGPGNPYARRVAQMRRAMLNAVSDEDLNEIVTNLIEQAKRGDPQAIKILFDRLFGSPTSSPDPDKVHLEELTLARMVREATPTKTELFIAEMDI